jgi:hypothetical protein
MTDQHPITPPPELVHQWVDMLSSRSDQAVFTMVAQWGADQELEACCETPSAAHWRPSMTNPYRAMCAELLLFSEEAGEICMNESLWPKSDPTCTLQQRARALLAQPVA